MNNFILLKDFINENLSKENGYGCVMLYANIPDWDKLVRRIVKESDLYNPPEEPGEYAYPESPHITILFGLHNEEILDHNIIYNIIKNIPSFTTFIKNISIFENDNKPYDVVKFNIEPNKSLLKARKELLELPNTQTFSEYHPHMTIAYVRKGLGKKYEKELKKNLKIKFDKGVYSDPDYRKSYFDLKKSKYEK